MTISGDSHSPTDREASAGGDTAMELLLGGEDNKTSPTDATSSAGRAYEETSGR